MERAYDIARLWAWLPAFRAVAEAQHLPTAARFMHVTPSALSRSVKQLEDAVGTPLFVRAGRRLRLNPSGERVLAAVRDAMRLVDDGVAAVGGATTRRIAIAAASPWLRPIIAAIAARQPEVAIDVADAAAADVRPLLLRGELDIVVADRIDHDDRLAVDRLCELPRSVWCGRGHPLARQRRVTQAALDGHAFAVAGEDGWPAERGRRIGLRTVRLEVAIAACESGTHLAVLPRMLARPAGLRDLRIAVAPGALYLQRRRPLVPAGEDWLLDTLVRSLRGTQR